MIPLRDAYLQGESNSTVLDWGSLSESSPSVGSGLEFAESTIFLTTRFSKKMSRGERLWKKQSHILQLFNSIYSGA